jgi:broad specificity phosphatase PhoE
MKSVYYPTFKDSVRNILLVRHFESVKNIKDCHGGLGDVLTEKGISQMNDVASVLDDLTKKMPVSSLHHSQSIQVVETASLISSKYGICPIEHSELKSVHLGQLDAISNKEANAMFPDAHSVMSLWRERKIEIHALSKIGIENPETFWNRVASVISSLHTELNIIVCSTSSMILLSHMLRGVSYLPGNGYLHIPIDNGQTIDFDLAYGKSVLNREHTSKNLVEYLK